MLGEPEGLPEIFPRAQPCSPVVIGSMIHCMLLLNVEVHFLRKLVKGMQILVNYPIILTHTVVIAELHARAWAEPHSQVNLPIPENLVIT